MIRLATLILLAAFADAAAQSAGDDAHLLETISWPMTSEGRAAEIASDAGLATLSATTKKTEVRVWRSIALFGLTDGWVITPGRIDRYSNGYRRRDPAVHGGLIAASDKIRFDSTIRRIVADALIRAFAKISTNPEAQAGCAMKDGAGLDIEGVVDGRYFSFGVSNPWYCHHRHGQSGEVVAAYARLVKYAPVAAY